MIYNTLLENLLLPVGDVLLRTSFMSELKRWRKLQWLSEPNLVELQKKNLERVLRFATAQVPYYGRLNIESSTDPIRDLENFPVIGKLDIKADTEAFLTRNRSKLICSKSSGSSGIQSAVYMTPREMSRSQAIQTLWWEWAGFRLGEKYFQRGMTVDRGIVKRMKDILLRTTYVSAFQLDDKDATRWLEHLLRYPHRFMGGYASSLYVFAKLAGELGIDGVRFESAISWGDKLFDHYKETIEKQFGCRVFDTYGCTEGAMIAGQCEYGTFHIMTPHVYLELLDEEDRPVPDGHIGKVVVTRLDGFAMPLIRYRLGDLAERASSSIKCKCGRNLPMLARVIGRETDVVTTPSGKHLIVHFFTGIMEHFVEIRQFQVIQKTPGSIEIDYIPETGFSSAVLARLRRIMYERAGEEFPLEFRKVSTISASPSGKPEIVRRLTAENN